MRRFSITCYGKQKTLEDIRTEKSKQFKKLKTKKNTNEYNKWFLRYNPELNKKNKPVSKPKKTKEDLINEAKLALEAKAITSKAVIAELEKLNKTSNVEKNRSSGIKTRKSSYSSSSSSLLKDSLGSAFIRPTNKQRTMKYAKKLNKNKDRISDDQFLFIQNDFTPSSMTTQLTDEKLYKK